MRISETLSRLVKPGAAKPAPGAAKLSRLADFGANPGDLDGWFHKPEGAADTAPLVVVLHGCTQNAAGYDHHSGWSQLADRHGFLLLFPEQRAANNPNRCFNWFEPGDVRRGEGEAASIRAMIEAMIRAHKADPARIFCTGLSAGGAMTSVMLATYPEVFAAGAVIAGLPYGCAANMGNAFGYMHGRLRLTPQALGAKVSGASDHRGPWPRVSVWHGTADPTVVQSNASDVVMQWLTVAGLPAAPTVTETVDGYPHRIWRNAAGAVQVEEYVITGMGHGTPLAAGIEDGQSGVAGPFMLEAGISSTDLIARFFGIGGSWVEGERGRPGPATYPRAAQKAPTGDMAGVQTVIEDALRAAGLMR